MEGIKAHMRLSGVDKSIVLGVVERPDQVKRANGWLISIHDDMLVPFGAIHPGLEDKAAVVRRLRPSAGWRPPPSSRVSREDAECQRTYLPNTM